MALRAIALLSVLGMVFFAGCGSCPHFGAAPPKFKLCQGGRLLDELAWLYADFNDVVLGIDYYQDMNDEFGADTYR